MQREVVKEAPPSSPSWCEQHTFTHIIDRIFIHSSLISSISPMRLVLRGLIPWSPIADHPKAAEAPRKEEGNSDSAGESKVHDYLNWLSIVRLDVACWTSTGFKQFHKKWVCNTTDFPKPPPYSPCHIKDDDFFRSISSEKIISSRVSHLHIVFLLFWILLRLFLFSPSFY